MSESEILRMEVRDVPEHLGLGEVGVVDRVGVDRVLEVSALGERCTA